MSQTPESAYPQQFTGTQRFAVLDQLGAGSMCVVYKAKDRKHGDIVALKTLRHLDSNSLYRLKQEFRALSHFDHPNLVSFSELVYSDQGWFVTMELVEGVDFLTYCRGERTDEPTVSMTTWSGDQSGVPTFGLDEDSITTERVTKRGLPDMIRLRSCMRQLADGVTTLHAAGRIHRDLKPSNVLVTEAGRVVILDFGLVAEIDQDYTEGTLHQNIAGSAAYMSPEQSVGKPLTEASDWYSVGVMLYEALTGTWPYTGHLYQILTLKQEKDPPPPSTYVDGIPPDLEALCMRLLHRDPAQRPDGAEVLAFFRASKPVPVRRIVSRPRFRFRNPQLHAMLEAFQATKQGHPVTMLVRGAQGSGKTALARELIKSVKRRDEVIILKGRCFEWESLPFKALDGMMDNLSRALRRMDHREVAKLSNPGLPYLGHFFPVLERVDALGLTEPADLKRLPPAVVRQRAFEGLFQLLCALAEDQPLLLFFDDVQWGDVDSAAVLAEIVRFSKGLPIFVVMAYRTDCPAPFIARYVQPVQQAGIDVRTLDLEPLSLEQSCVIAAEMLQTRQDDPKVVRIARESGGNPAFIQELVRQLEFQDQRAALSVEEDLNEVTVKAIQSLPDGARRLLCVLALCEHPVPDEIGLFAADLGGDAFQALSTLRAHNLIRIAGVGGADTFEIVSERVRDFVVDRIPEDWKTTIHARLAHAMEAQGGVPPSQLVGHYIGAHQYEKAGLVAWLSASEALERGQIHEAIRLLRLAREHGSWTSRERRMILVRLGEALAEVGEGREAAQVFQEAAAQTGEARSQELLHRAAEELIASGQVDQGTVLLDQLLVEAGVRIGSSRGWLGGGLRQIRRMRLRWRGMDFSSKAETSVPEAELFKVDLCWTRALAVSLVDREQAATAQMTHLELALELGEPERALRALAAEIRFPAWSLESGWRERYEHVLEQAKGCGSKQTLARATSSAAIATHLEGAWSEAAKLGLSAEQMFRHNHVGATWERFQARLLAARALVAHGALARAAEVLHPLLQELEPIDNPLFTVLALGCAGSWLAMAQDEPAEAIRRLQRAAASMSERGIPLYRSTAGLASLELYRGDLRAAEQRFQTHWNALMEGLTATTPDVAVEFWLARARVAAASGDGSTLGRALGAVREAGLAWAEPWCKLLELQRKGADLRPLIPLFAQTGQHLGEAVARQLCGESIDGWWVERGVRDPRRMVAVIAGAS